MNRDRIDGSQSKHVKGHDRKGAGRWFGNDYNLDKRDHRPHASGKLQRTYGIRQDEAREQILELQSRY